MTRSTTILAAFAALTLSGVAATASASAPPGSAPTGSEPVSSAPACSTDAVSGDVVVFAAASLTDSFTSIGDAFMAANPDSNVTFNFAASSDLVGSINEGAVADIFASADQNNMGKLTAADGEGAIGDPVTFATNTLEILVEAGNPQGITGLADLANADLTVVSTDPEVPIGAYTQQVLDAAGVTVDFDSYVENVKGIVDAVTSGEVDAGIVYATDVQATDDEADGVEIPADVNVTADYPIAVPATAANADGAAAFESFVLCQDGQAILAEYGFGAP